MKTMADENFPRPALEALRKAGWDVAAVRRPRPQRSLSSICI